MWMAIDSCSDMLIIAVLFSIPFLMTPTMEFVFFTTAAHWFAHWFSLSYPPQPQVAHHHQSRPHQYLGKLGFFAFMCITLYLLTLICICHDCPFTQFGDSLRTTLQSASVFTTLKMCNTILTCAGAVRLVCLHCIHCMFEAAAV